MLKCQWYGIYFDTCFRYEKRFNFYHHKSLFNRFTQNLDVFSKANVF